MSKLYPYTSAQILTDELFTAYGGQTGTTTAFQRQVAYFNAEYAMAQNLSAFAPVTTVTGTYAYPFTDSHISPGRELFLDWKYVQRVPQVTFIDTQEDKYYSISGTANINVGFRNGEYGILDVFTIAGNCACIPYFSYGSPTTLAPYQVEVIYEAGLPSGTYTAPNYLTALTLLAQVWVDELFGCGNESAPGILITEFANQDYREKRANVFATSLGTNPKALTAYSLVKSLMRPRYVSL